MLRWFEASQVYVPYRPLDVSPADLGRPFEDVYLVTEDKVRLNAWFFPVNPSSLRSHLALLVMHGNGGNISHRLPFYQAWLELGLNVFAFDYRGYGRSQGQPSEQGTYLDAQAAHHWLVQRGFGPSQIIAIGKSLGGGIASELALRATLGGLILQNTFTCIPDIGAELFPWLPVRQMASIHYHTLKKLPRIHVPVLIVHSRGDSLVRFHHAERNFAAANSPKMFWETSGNHNGTLEAGRAKYLAGLNEYLRRYFPSHEYSPGR